MSIITEWQGCFKVLFIYYLFFPFIYLNFLLQSFKNETFEVSMGTVIWFDGIAAGLPHCSVKEDQYLFSTLVAGKELVDPVWLSLPSLNFQTTLWCNLEIRDNCLWLLTCPCKPRNHFKLLGISLWMSVAELVFSAVQHLDSHLQASAVGCFLHLFLTCQHLLDKPWEQK